MSFGKVQTVFGRSALAMLVALALTTAPWGTADASESPQDQPRSTLTIVEENAITAAEVSAGWCVRGATFAVLFSAAFSLPSFFLGIGAPYTAARAGTAALAGCGVAVTWRAAAKGVAYVDGMINPLPPLPVSPPRRPLPVKDQPRLIHTSG